MIYSSSYVYSEFKYGTPYKFFMQQSIFFILGSILMYVFSRTDYKVYYKHANTFLGICFFLLIIVLIPGIGSVRNGSRSWFSILGLGFQPSELLKLSLIIFTSKYLCNNDHLKRNVFNSWIYAWYGSSLLWCLDVIIIKRGLNYYKRKQIDIYNYNSYFTNWSYNDLFK